MRNNDCTKALLATVISIFLLMTMLAINAHAAKFKGEVKEVIPANATMEKVITKSINFIKTIKLKNTKAYGQRVIVIDAKLPRRLQQGRRMIIHTAHGKILAKIIAIITPKTSIGRIERIFKHKHVNIIINDLKRKRVVVLKARKEINVKKQNKVLIFIQRIHRTMMEGC